MTNESFRRDLADYIQGELKHAGAFYFRSNSVRNMKALCWYGTRDVRIEDRPDPVIEAPTDAIVRVTAAGLSRAGIVLLERRALERASALDGDE
jgi:hypothetical protein